ncbi:hypothetical protein VMHJH2_07220 [Streptococcus uberis]|uniref:hypothetical protein n=1 Tax=Streptococcus uberis TaxID=1349 RepID=UPI0021502B81|nr:hypothetical protein [Streptococcus uberis]MCR4258305.1 hypothetical protein [Streptococcus uberis]
MSKKQDQKRGCGCLSIIGFLIVFIFVYNLVSCDDKQDNNSTEPKTEQTSKTKESSTEESSSSDSMKKMTADKMPEFIEYFQNDLTEKGIATGDVQFDNEDTALHLIVPDSYKDYSDSDMLEFAKLTQQREHEAFNVWASINEIDYNDPPFLVIRTSDGERLATETISGDMKIK